jgi:hypothetical protein
MTPEQARKVTSAAPAGSVYAAMARKVLKEAAGSTYPPPRKF